jgi:O-antigen/teichoic acid export membrane protein
LEPFDHTGQFQGLDENAEISRLAVRNAGITVFAQGCVFAIQVLGAMVLARMLIPADFGLVTMVTTFSLLLSSFGLAGFTDAILQTPRINHSLASNLFWINLAGAATLAVAFGAASSLLARFYGDPQIVNVAIGFTPAIFFSIVPVVHLGLLKRAMRFGAASWNDIAGRISYVITAIGCAYLGFGYWALVAGAIAQPIVICAGAWILCPWRPGFPRRVEGTGTMVRFAMNVYGRYSLNYGTGNTDNLLVGWRFGASALGFYKKAFDLFVLPSCQLLVPILAVVVTALSRKNHDRDEFKRYFLKALCIVAFVGMAVGGDLTLIGQDLVRLLLGPAWKESGRIFTWFAPGIGLMLLYQTTAWIHLSMGTTARWLRWTVLELTITVILFLLGLRWGPVGVAGAWTTSFLILMLPGFWYAGKPIALPLTSVVGAVWRYVAAAVIAELMSVKLIVSTQWRLVAEPSGVVGEMAKIVTISALFAALYLGAVVILFGGLEPLRQFTRLLPDLLPGVSSRIAFRFARKPAHIVGRATVDSAVPLGASEE